MVTTGTNLGTCLCCGGQGVQTNKQTGIREICKCCGGYGKRGTINEPIYVCKGDYSGSRCE
jgi:hypothetical protein